MKSSRKKQQAEQRIALCHDKKFNPFAISLTAQNLMEMQLKKFLTSKHPKQRLAKRQKWLLLPAAVRNYIKLTMLEKLGSEMTRRDLTPSCIAAITCAELPHNQWQNLMEILICTSMHADSTDSMKVASITTIGYVCKNIKPGVLDIHLKQIFQVVIFGLKIENSNRVKFAAVRTLIKSLRLLRYVWEEETTRNTLINAVCVVANLSKNKIKIACLTCLVKIATLYYEHLHDNMEHQLLEVTTAAIKSDISELKQKGIQFWVSVCLKEKQLQQETNSSTGSFFSKEVMKKVVPLLLTALTKQLNTENETSPCTWVCMIAHNCLPFMATRCRDHIIKDVLDFVILQISNSNWKQRYAAVSVFGAMLKGPKANNLKPLFDLIIPHLPHLLQDVNLVLRQTTAYAIENMCDILPKLQFTEVQINTLVNLFIQNFNSEVETETAFVVCKLIRCVYAKRECSILAQYFGIIIRKLLEVIITATKPNKCNTRKYAYDTLDFITSSCPLECYDNLKGILDVVLNAILRECNPTSVLPILNVVLKKIQLNDIYEKSDTIMRALLKILKKDEECWEKNCPQTFRTIGAFAERMKENFLKHMREFAPILILALKKRDKRKVYKSALRLTREITGILGESLESFYNDVIPILINDFQATPLKSIQVCILSVLCVIISSIDTRRSKYTIELIHLLKTTSENEISSTKSQSEKNHINKFRENCLKLHIAILRGFKKGGLRNNSILRNDGGLITDYVTPLKSHIADIIKLLNRIASDSNSNDTCVLAACELMRIISKMCGKEGKEMLDSELIHHFVSKEQIKL